MHCFDKMSVLPRHCRRVRICMSTIARFSGIVHSPHVGKQLLTGKSHAGMRHKQNAANSNSFTSKLDTLPIDRHGRSSKGEGFRPFSARSLFLRADKRRAAFTREISSITPKGLTTSHPLRGQGFGSYRILRFAVCHDDDRSPKSKEADFSQQLRVDAGQHYRVQITSSGLSFCGASPNDVPSARPPCLKAGRLESIHLDFSYGGVVFNAPDRRVISL